MPIYEYQCADCGTSFEELVIGKNGTKPECSGCGSKSVERKFSTFAAQTSGGSTSSAQSFEGGGGMCGCGQRPAGMCGMN